MKKNNIEKSKQVLNEDAIETGLMLAGFVPIIGEVADIILIIRYLIKGEYIYAGLMLVALIPTVGDFIAKPFIKLLQGSKVALKGGDDLVRVLSSNPKALEQYKKLGKYFDSPEVGKLIKQIEKVPGIGSKAAEGMKKSILEHKKVLKKLTGKKTKVSSASPQSIPTIKDFFQKRALARYMKDKGVTTPPSNVVSNWMNVVRAGRKERRDLVKKVISASNILDMFGLPSFESFQHKVDTDKEFRTQLANSPEFSQIMSQVSTPEELDAIVKGQTPTVNSSSGEGSSSTVGGLFSLLGGGAVLSGSKGLKFLKALAKRLT